ncbi:MAG: PIN domain-containing protein [bacterium]|nr:PIN domain-containing protein [bacterium]
MKYFIDTNIFLRVLIQEDKKQFTECKNLLQRVKENKLDACTGTIVLAEVVWTLGSYYQYSKAQVVEAVKSIFNLRGLRILDTYDNARAIELFEKYSVKYIDTLIASYAEIADKDITIISYDRDFAKLPVLYKTPREVI